MTIIFTSWNQIMLKYAIYASVCIQIENWHTHGLKKENLKKYMHNIW